jgi:iron complex transport system ATP-binding protein
MPISPNQPQQKRNQTIHLICGAGTGSSLMKLLLDDGYAVTSGVLNLLDTDQETADFLKVPIIREAPLSPISEVAHKNNLECVQKSDAVILTSIPFGCGNIKNLDAALFALEHNVPTLVLNESPIGGRDFTKGDAEKKMVTLKNEGAIFVENQRDLFAALDGLKVKFSVDKNPSLADNKLMLSQKIHVSNGVTN